MDNYLLFYRIGCFAFPQLSNAGYIVCVNPKQASKNAADRKAIIAALKEQLKKGAKSLVGNKGYRRYLKMC